MPGCQLPEQFQQIRRPQLIFPPPPKHTHTHRHTRKHCHNNKTQPHEKHAPVNLLRHCFYVADYKKKYYEWQFFQTELFHMKQYKDEEKPLCKSNAKQTVSDKCKSEVLLQIAICQNSLVNCLAEVPSSTLITL